MAGGAAGWWRWLCALEAADDEMGGSEEAQAGACRREGFAVFPLGDTGRARRTDGSDLLLMLVLLLLVVDGCGWCCEWVW